MMARRMVLAVCYVLILAAGVAVSAASALEKEPSALFWSALDAAGWGDDQAQYAVAMMYMQGVDVERDEAEAAKWFQKSADQGNSRAQFKLAEMYEKGIGVPKDLEKATKLYRTAGPEADTNDAAYYEALKEVRMEKMAQAHDLEMQDKQYKHQEKMQRERLKADEKIARERYRRFNGYRGHRNYRRY